MDASSTPHSPTASDLPVRCVAQMVETLKMGGAEKLAVQIANALAARGLDSHLYVLVESGPLVDQIDARVKLRFFDIHRASLRNPTAFASSIVSGYGRLRQAVEEDGIDLIQSHLPGANFWGLLLNLRGVCAVIPTVHNNREFDYGDADHPLRFRLRRMAYRAMLKRSWAMVAVSEQSRLSLLETLGVSESHADRLFAVPNGVVIPEPLGADQRVALRSRYGCGDRDLLLVAAGRHDTQKNFTTLIKAFSEFPGDTRPWRLVLAGEGPLHADHIQQAREAGLAERIYFPGVLTDLGMLMQAADAFVLPSLWEGLPLVLLEALAAGLPVIGTRIDGINEIITEQETGLLVDPGGTSELATALIRLSTSPKIRRELGDAGRERVRGNYSLDRVVEDLLSIYTRGKPIPRHNETTVSE